MPHKAKRNVLLTKPIKVLRDTFVRHGDLGFVSLGKLSKWLNEQRRALSPDEPFWRKLYHDERFGLRAQIADEVAGLGYGAVLKKFAEKTGPDHTDYEIFVGSLPDPVRFFIRSLDFKEVSAYFVDTGSVAFVSFASPGVWALCVEEADDLAPSFHSVDEAGVFDAVLYAWDSWRSVHEWEPSHLCVWLDSAIEEMRIKAGAMFDEAVAVSQDGKRILAADYVIAYEVGPRRKLTLRDFDRTTFLPQKLALGRVHQVKRNWPRGKKTPETLIADALKPRVVSKILADAQAHGCMQALLTIGEQRILFTPEASLPKGESAPPPEPQYPRTEDAPDPSSDHEGPVKIDGVIPPSFEEQPGGVIGPEFVEGDSFDMNTPVYYGPQPVDEGSPDRDGILPDDFDVPFMYGPLPTDEQGAMVVSSAEKPDQAKSESDDDLTETLDDKTGDDKPKP